jgi:hypothetical protein
MRPRAEHDRKIAVTVSNVFSMADVVTLRPVAAALVLLVG